MYRCAPGIIVVAFPSISTGAYRYPLEKAAPIALRTVIGYLIHLKKNILGLKTGLDEIKHGTLS